jgi:hypothetical protein
MKKLNALVLQSLALASLLMPAVGFAQSGTALKADTLRAEPFSDAKKLSTIAKGDSVEIVSKKGAWLQIKSKKNTGWVRLFSVRQGASNSNQVKGVIDVANGRAGSGQVISTTGIRGLDAEDLKQAKFNEDEMKKLENNQLSAENGQQFASAGGLKAIQFSYLKAAK